MVSKRRLILELASVFVFFLLLVYSPALTSTPSPTPSFKPISLKVVSTAGPTYSSRVMLEKAMKLIEERAGGRIKFEYYAGDTLIKHSEAFPSMKDNIVQMGMVSTGYEADRMGIAAITTYAPFCYDIEEFSKHWRDPGGLYDFWAPYYEKVGLKLLSFPCAGGTQINFRTSVKTLKDFKGKLVRCPAGIHTEIVKLWGAQPVFIDNPEVYIALSKGTVDGSLGASLDSTISLKQYEVAPYFTILDINQGVIQQAINLKVYNSLPSDLQKLIMDTFLELEREHYTNIGNKIKTDLENLKTKPGVQIYVPTKEEKAEWIGGIGPLYKKWESTYGAAWQKFWEIQKHLHK